MCGPSLEEGKHTFRDMRLCSTAGQKLIKVMKHESVFNINLCMHAIQLVVRPSHIMKGSTIVITIADNKMTATTLVNREAILPPALRPSPLFNTLLNARPPSRG